MVEEKYGLSSNQTNQSSSTQLKDEALLLFKDVDDIGKRIAENWTKRGNSSTTTHKDFGMLCELVLQFSFICSRVTPNQ